MWKLRDWIVPQKLTKFLSSNPRAGAYLERNPEKIDWSFLSNNPDAIEILEKNQDKIDWFQLSKNTAAMELLEANQDKIEWDQLSMNYGIFVYDYASMTRPFTEELMQNRFHPKNIGKFEDWGYE